MDTTWIARARALMRAYRTSQASLADALGCTRGAVGHYLSGRRTPNLAQLEALAAALDTEPAWLLYGAETSGVRDQPPDYGSEAGLIPLMSPAGQEAGYLALPHPGRCYAVLVNSNEHAPRFHTGEALLIDQEVKPVAGDEIALHYHDGTIEPYVLIQSSPDGCSIGNITGKKQIRILRAEEFKHRHRIIAVFRASEVQKA